MKRTLATAAVLLTLVGCNCGEMMEDSMNEAVAEALENAESPPAEGATGDSTGGAQVTCNLIENLQQCKSYPANNPFNQGNQNACNMQQGTWGGTECPSENQIGHCEKPTYTIYYYDGADASAAEDACSVLRGTWHAEG